MKKITSLLIVITMLASVFAYPVFAEGTIADRISIENASASPLVFSKMQMGKFPVKITNTGEATDAKAEIYIDGYLQSGAGSALFTVYSENNECFDVHIPPMIDASVNHTLTVRLIFADGSAKNAEIPFTVNKTLPKITATVVSNPYSVTAGTEIYYSVRFNFSDDRYGYKLRTSIDINGEHIPMLDSEFFAGNGEVKQFTVPAELTNVDLYKYSFKINVNPNPQYGEVSTYAERSVEMTGPKAMEYKNINNLIKPVLIKAYVKTNAPAYSYASLTGYRTTIPAGSYVTYMNPDSSKSMRSAKVKTDDGQIYWVPMANLMIVTGDYVIPDELSYEQKELFVNVNGYASETNYLLWVNLERQILTVFLGSKGNWKYVNTFPVCSGKNSTPTPTVQHRIEYITRWVTPTYTCDPVLALYDGYALHNQPVSPSGYVTDPTMGKPASAGCIRMLKHHIDWIRYTVPVKTNVVIH